MSVMTTLAPARDLAVRVTHAGSLLPQGAPDPQGRFKMPAPERRAGPPHEAKRTAPNAIAVLVLNAEFIGGEELDSEAAR